MSRRRLMSRSQQCYAIKRILSKSTCPANPRPGWLINALLFFAFGLSSATIERGRS
jgi:hypothetical protein